MLKTYTCPCRILRFSTVSRTASLCPTASHLDLAIVQLTSSLYKVKMTVDSAWCMPETEKKIAWSSPSTVS